MKKKIVDISTGFLALVGLVCALAFAGLIPALNILVSAHGLTVKLILLLPLVLIAACAEKEHARLQFIRLSAVLLGGACLFFALPKLVMLGKPEASAVQELLMYVLDPIVMIVGALTVCRICAMLTHKGMPKEYLPNALMVILVLAVIFISVAYFLMSTATAENYEARQKIYSLVGAKSGETLRYILLIAPSALLGVLAVLKKSSRPAVLFTFAAAACIIIVTAFGLWNSETGMSNYYNLMTMTFIKPFLWGAAALWAGTAVLIQRNKQK